MWERVSLWRTPVDNLQVTLTLGPLGTLPTGSPTEFPLHCPSTLTTFVGAFGPGAGSGDRIL